MKSSIMYDVMSSNKYMIDVPFFNSKKEKLAEFAKQFNFAIDEEEAIFQYEEMFHPTIDLKTETIQMLDFLLSLMSGITPLMINNLHKE